MPGDAVERLDDLIDPDVLERIAARGVDLDSLVGNARANGFAPQPLFELEDGLRRYAVWLE